jgi:hypothetical protein
MENNKGGHPLGQLDVLVYLPPCRPHGLEQPDGVLVRLVKAPQKPDGQGAKTGDDSG